MILSGGGSGGSPGLNLLAAAPTFTYPQGSRLTYEHRAVAPICTGWATFVSDPNK